MPSPLDKLIDLNAERAVLGSLLIDPDATGQVADLAMPDDFTNLGHQQLYAAALSLAQAGSVVDYITVLDHLSDDDLRKLGNGALRGAAYLTHLINSAPRYPAVTHHARIVHRLATLRRLMGAAGEIAKLAYNANGDEMDALFDRARRLIDAHAPSGSDEHLLMWLDSLDLFFRCQLDRCAEIDAQEAGKITARAMFPWEALKRYSNHARPGMLVGIIAPPGIGKTALVEGCAESWAQLGLNVVFFHLELSHQTMLDRRMCRQTGIELRLIEDGFVDGKTTAATDRMRAWKGGIHYVHCPGWTAARIVRLAQKLRDKGKCDALIVDYLQKMRRDYSAGKNLAQATGWNIELLKNCAEDLGVPVLLPAQLNVAGKREKIKTATYVRDTGELEDKANLVITLDRPLLIADVWSGGRAVAKAGARDLVAKCRVDKNTLGPTGPFELLFIGERFMFVDVETKEAEPPPLQF